MVFEFYRELCIRLKRGMVWMCAGPREVMFQWHFGPEGSINFTIPMVAILKCVDKHFKDGFITELVDNLKEARSQARLTSPGLRIKHETPNSNLH